MAWVTPKANDESTVGIGSQAWNIADGYTKIKILRIIIQLDLDEEIAMFGRKDDTELISHEELPYKRVEGFHKFIFHLKQLVGNCKFAIEKRSTEELMLENFIKRIDNVDNVGDGISDIFINDITKESELRIHEKHFKKCFDILREIKDELNFPINRAGLIFRQSDELDIDDIMRDIEEGG